MPADPPAGLPVDRPVDPDVDLRVAAQRAELAMHPARVLGAIALGGVLGSEVRYGLTLALPDRAGTVPWTTLAVNVTGCLAIGALMAGVRVWGVRRPLLRPFAGVGVLGGFTTFSAYAVGVDRLLAAGRVPAALLYLLLTPLLGLAAAVAGQRAAGRLLA